MDKKSEEMKFTIDNVQIKYKESDDGIEGSIESIDIIYQTTNTNETKTLSNVHTIYRPNSTTPYYLHKEYNNRIDVFLWKQLMEAMDTNSNFPKSAMNHHGDIHYIEYLMSTSTIKHTTGQSTSCITLTSECRSTIVHEIKNLFKLITQFEEFIWSKNDDLTYIKTNKLTLAPQLNGYPIVFTTTIDKLTEVYKNTNSELTKKIKLQQQDTPETCRKDNIKLKNEVFDIKSFY